TCAALVPVVGSISAFGQDDAAAQDERLTQQSLHEMAEQQRHLDEVDKQTMQHANDLQNFAKNSAPDNSDSDVAMAPAPVLSVKSGTVQQGTKVTLTSAAQGAVIYYTTTGWTPTTSSRRYTGPVIINATTHLQAFATAPNMNDSFLVHADYTVKGPAVPVFPLALEAGGLLHAKSRLHVVTGSTVNSKKARVGDKISILLDQDVKDGDAVIIPKGTPVDASISVVKPSGLLGTPGQIAFTASSLTFNGTTVVLKGGERLDGISHTTRSVLMWITFVGSIPAVMMHGGEAEIKPGMKFTVGVAADTPLKE
ncbi:MAG: chitobiase/beta-hexosaminidase C-terminal domain-containing protein, partial [Terracidiphilus sp.]